MRDIRVISLLICTFVALIGSFNSTEISEEKLRKNFEKINKDLEKNVQTNDPEENMARIERLFEQKSNNKFSTFFKGSSMIHTLELFTNLRIVLSDTYYCYDTEKARLMEETDDSFLAKYQVNEPNYSLSRIDMILEHYALKIAHVCSLYHYQSYDWPKMNFAFKQLAYGRLNELLVDKLPESQDVEENMKSIEELSSEFSSNNGALALACKQILELRSTLNEESCNEKGFDILLRNDLATEGKAHKWFDEPLRRTDKIFKYYAEKHSQLCQPIFRKKLYAALKDLDQDTNRAILALISSYFMRYYNKQSQILPLINEKIVGEKFEPVLVKLDELAEKNLMTDRIQLRRIERLEPSELMHYVEVMSANDPDHKYLRKVPDERSGKLVLDQDKIDILAKRYLIEPCEKYLKVMGSLVEADEYNSYQVREYLSAESMEKFAEELNYHMIRAGYKICNFISKRPQDMSKALRQRAIDWS